MKVTLCWLFTKIITKMYFLAHCPSSGGGDFSFLGYEPCVRLRNHSAGMDSLMRFSSLLLCTDTSARQVCLNAGGDTSLLEEDHVDTWRQWSVSETCHVTHNTKYLVLSPPDTCHLDLAPGHHVMFKTLIEDTEIIR